MGFIPPAMTKNCCCSKSSLNRVVMRLRSAMIMLLSSTTLQGHHIALISKGAASDVQAVDHREIAYRLTYRLTLQRHLSISRFISIGYSVFMSSVLNVFIALTP